MCKKIIKRLLELLIYSSILTVIAYVLSLIICRIKSYDLTTVMFVIGIIIAIISGLSLCQGNPTGSLGGSIGRDFVGTGSEQYSNYVNMEVTRIERKATGYWDSIKNHGLMNPRPIRVNILISGIVICIISIIILKIQ